MLTRIISDSCSCLSTVVEKITSVVYSHVYNYFTTGCPTRLHSLLLSSCGFCFSCSSTAVTSKLLSFADLLKLIDLVIHDTWWVCSAFSAYSSAEVVSESMSVCRHLFVLWSSSISSFNSLRLRPLALHSFFCFSASKYSTSSFAWQKRLPTRDAYHWDHFLQVTDRSDMVTDNTFG